MCIDCNKQLQEHKIQISDVYLYQYFIQPTFFLASWQTICWRCPAVVRRVFAGLQSFLLAQVQSILCSHFSCFHELQSLHSVAQTSTFQVYKCSTLMKVHWNPLPSSHAACPSIPAVLRTSSSTYMRSSQWRRQPRTIMHLELTITLLLQTGRLKGQY